MENEEYETDDNRDVIQMSDYRIQECIGVNKDNIDIIGKALEDYWSHVYHGAHMINEINDARVLIHKIKEQMKKFGEIKVAICLKDMEDAIK